MPLKRFNPAGHLCHAVVHNGVAYVSGQVPDDTSLDVEGQTRQVLAKVEQHLKDAGSSKSQMLSATIWLKDIRDRDRMNSIWVPWIGRDLCARVCVQAELAKPEILVEIAVIAAAD
jgi:enamine deaminase RidA (YjgF/YER057c/UK114 family)